MVLKLGSILALVLLLCAPLRVGAALMMDQEVLPGSPIGAYTDTKSSVQHAQTFTVGVGGQLTRLDLYVYRDSLTTDELEFDLRPVLAGTPSENDGTALASFNIGAASVGTVAGGFITLNLGLYGINISPGEMYSIVLQSEGGYTWVGPNEFFTPTYMPGDPFHRRTDIEPLTWTMSSADGFDQAFTTYVTTAAPEPSALTLLALAGAALALVRRRRA